MPGCPRCGTSTASSRELDNLCPACLLELALDDPAPDRETDGDDGGLVPERSGAYRVLSVLASEPGRTTYLAEPDGGGPLVTLDVASFERPEDARARETARQRLSRLRALDHPGLARVIDGQCPPSGDAWVAATFFSGKRLDVYCAGASAGAAERAGLFESACDAVRAAHAAGIVHGRLGPDSIVVRGPGRAGSRVVVTGFSLVVRGASPAAADDVRALAAIARGLGSSADVEDAETIEELRDAVCDAWRRSS